MEIILLEKIRHLGSLGDVVKVKSGFARNYLVPQGKAVYKTKEKMAEFAVRRAELEAKQAEYLQAAEMRKAKLLALSAVKIAAKVGEEGKIFGSISTRDISEAIIKAGVEVSKSEIDLPTGPLRHVGEYDIVIELHSDITASVKIIIVPEA